MSIEENKAIVRRYREAHNANRLNELDAVVAADLTSHNLLPGLPPGRKMPASRSIRERRRHSPTWSPPPTT